MRQVEVLVIEGAMASSVAITFDMLETTNRLLEASRRPAAFAVRASGSGARRFAPTHATAEGGPDLLIVPGLGLTNQAAIREGLARPDMRAAQRRVGEVARAGALIAGSCSATFLLAASGVLDGRRATTTWWLAPIFRRLHPLVELDADAVVVRDGQVVTAGAAMAQIDLMLTLIAAQVSPDVANACARYMLLDGRRSQTPYASLGLVAAADERIARAEAWARPRLEQGVSVEQLATAAGLTPRTFARRLERVTGLSPVRFLQRLRLEQATELVQSTRLSIEEIARRVGYAEPSTLRRLLRREGRNARSMRSADRRAAA